MLEKKVFEMNTEEWFAETMEVGGVEILRRIPYEQKEEFIHELAAMVLVADEDTGICYVSSLYDVVFNYLYVKYYTNIDVDGIKEIDDFRKLYDFCDMTGILDDKMGHEDTWIIKNMWDSYSEAIIKQYEKRNSLEHQAKLMLSTDIDTNKAETRELIEKLIDMQGAMKEKEERDNVLDFGKAKKNTGVKTGGVKLNLGKKN